MLLPSRYLSNIQKRLAKPTTQKPSSHRSARAIKRRQKRRGARVRLKNFQAANSLRVEHHEVFRVIGREASQLVRDIQLRVAQVGDERARSRSSERPRLQA